MRGKQEISFREFGLKLERSIKSKCEICSEHFGVFKKQHICKRCFISVCQNCANLKVKTYRSDRLIKMHRMCKRCEIDYTKIQKYIDTNKLAFGQDSQVIFIWLKQLGYKSLPKGPVKKKNYFKVLSLEKMWASLNFTFRQFVGMVLQKSQTSDQILLDCLTWGIEQLNKIKQFQVEHTFYLYLFFLCHCRPQTAIIFTIQTLKLSGQKQIKIEQFNQLLQQEQFSQIQLYKVENLLEVEINRIQAQASVNIFPLSTSIDIISLLFTYKSVDTLIKSIVYIFLECKESLSVKSEEIFIDILKRAYLLNVRGSIKHFQMSTSKLEQSFQSSSKDNDLQKELEILKKKYSEQEEKIKELQSKYNSKNYKDDDEMSNSLIFSNSKMLELSGFGHEDYRQTYMSTKVDNLQSFQSILQVKNSQIDKLKQALASKQRESTQIQEQLRKSSQFNEVELVKAKQQLKQKDKTIKKITDQNQSLKNMNNLLLLKLNELSGLLMDQEQQQIKQSEEKLEIMKKEILDLDPKMKDQCRIY